MGWIDYKFFYRDLYIGKLSLTLDEIIQIAEEYKLTLLIDIKNSATAKKVINEKELPNSTVFSSKDHFAIKYIKQALGDNVKALISIDSKPINIKCLIESAKVDGISWNYVFIDRSLLEEVKNSGYIVYAWVVNDKNIYRKLNRTRLIDAIITDAPWKLN
ncbi:MAG: glycerophosphodiester phosphodiesterase [Staphylothermus sp.]|nr:glycerophosphodiester phosphodiesterase [Staphylothermus sp.]